MNRLQPIADEGPDIFEHAAHGAESETIRPLYLILGDRIEIPDRN